MPESLNTRMDVPGLAMPPSCSSVQPLPGALSTELSNRVTENQRNTGRKEWGPRSHLLHLLVYREGIQGPEKVADLPKNTQQVREQDRSGCLRHILVQLRYMGGGQICRVRNGETEAQRGSPWG